MLENLLKNKLVKNQLVKQVNEHLPEITKGVENLISEKLQEQELRGNETDVSFTIFNSDKGAIVSLRFDEKDGKITRLEQATTLQNFLSELIKNYLQ